MSMDGSGKVREDSAIAAEYAGEDGHEIGDMPLHP
jgi:hypothetical protein